MAGLTRKVLVVNSLSGVLQTLFSSLLIIVTIPVFIRLLGTEAYGVFSLIMVVGNLSTLANLGLTTSLIKFLSEQGKVAESAYDIIVTLILLFAVIAPITLIGIVLSQFFLREVFAIPSAIMSDATWLFSFLLIANLFLLLGQTFNAILDAQQKIHLTNALQLLYNLTYWGLILTVLLLGYSLKAVGLMACLSAFFWFVAVTAVGLRTWGILTVVGLGENFLRVARKQIAYGSRVYAGGLIGFFYEPFTKILLSHFVGVTQVGFFDIALKIRSQLWGLISKILYPLYPLIPQLQDHAKVRLLVHDLEQKTLFLLLPVIAMCAFATQPLIAIWIGANVQIISTTTIAILVAYLVAVTVTPIYQYLLVKGLASKTIILQSANVAVNGTLFLATFSWLGYYAAVVGNVGAILSSFALSLYYQKKYLNSLILDSWNQLLKLMALLGGCFIVGYAMSVLISSALVRLLIIPLTIGIVAILAYRLLRLFTPGDIVRYTGNQRWLTQIGTKVLCKV